MSNNSDKDIECYPFVVFQRIYIAILDAKDYEQVLNEHCNLTYFDMPTTINMYASSILDKLRGMVFESHLLSSIATG